MRSARRLGGSYRVLVDANQHVDREGAVRAGVGFYGKNTMLITRRHGSWVVLGTLVTDVEVEPSPPLELDCGDCRLCIDACPTGALDEPGTLDANRCLSYWTQAPEPIPEAYRESLADMVYGCDICQDVCPWNRGVEKRRRDDPAHGEPHGFAGRLAAGRRIGAGRALRRLYVPRNDPRYLRRNALVALGNIGGAADAALAEPFASGDDDLLREHAEWALGPDRRTGALGVSHEQRAHAERWLAWVRLGAVPFVAFQAVVADPYTVGQGVWLWATTAAFAAGAVVVATPGPA